MLIIGAVYTWMLNHLIFYCKSRCGPRLYSFTHFVSNLYKSFFWGMRLKSQHFGFKFFKNNMPGLLFPDDFVGVAESKLALKSMITFIYN